MQHSVNRLGALADEFRELEARLADPGTASDLDLLRTVSRRYRELEPIVAAQQALGARQGDLATARELLEHATEDERVHLGEEVDEALADIERLEGELRDLLLPHDPHAGRAVIMEIRGAEGGEEANLFARDLYDMYLAYAGKRGWKSRRCRTTRASSGASIRSRSSCAAATRGSASSSRAARTVCSACR